MKIQLPSIGGLRKVIKVPGGSVAVGTTISELGSGTVTLAQLSAIITQIQAQQQNTGGGNIGNGTEAVLVPGQGLSGGGAVLGSVPIRLTAPIPWFDDAGGGADGDPGPPGAAGKAGATGGVGPLGPAIFMSADDGVDGDVGPPGLQGIAGAAGAAGAPGSAGVAGPPGTTLVYANTTVPAGNTVSNTSAETFFASSYTIPASALVAGMALRVRLFGVYSTGIVAPSLALKIYFGATVMIASGTLTTVAGVTNDGWSAEGLFVVQTIGVIGTVEAQGLSEFSTASTAVLFVNMDNTAPVTVNTTIAQTVQSSVQWGGTVNASDTITLREMTVEIMSAAGIASPPPPPPFSVLFAEDGEEGAIGPQGMPGLPGIAGAQGLPGPAVFMISDDGADGDAGPPGTAGVSGSSGSTNVTPDTHPAIPTGVGLGPNDEFESGTTIDTSGSRYSGATPWTAFNGGSASTTLSQGVIRLTSANGVANTQGYSQPIPGGNWEYTCRMAINPVAYIDGMFISVAGGNQMTLLIFSSAYYVQQRSSPTTFVANVVSGAGGVPTSGFAYLRIAYNGTNIIYSVSPTGYNSDFTVLLTETPAVHLGAVPTLVGIESDANGAGVPAIATFDWFRQTA
jgi:hypothetical protein